MTITRPTLLSFVCMIMLCTDLHAANDTLAIGNRNVIVQGDTIVYYNDSAYINCIFYKERNLKTLTILPFIRLDSLSDHVVVENYMPIEIEEYKTIA